MRGPIRFLAKRAVLVPLIAVAVLGLGVLVARAGTPTITDATTPPAGHFAGACAGCHTVVPNGTIVNGEAADGSDTETDTVEPGGSKNDTEGVDAQGDHLGGHNDTDTVDAQGDQNSQNGTEGVAAQGHHGDQGSQGAHETVGAGVHARGGESGDQQGDQGSSAPSAGMTHAPRHSSSTDTPGGGSSGDSGGGHSHGNDHGNGGMGGSGGNGSGNGSGD